MDSDTLQLLRDEYSDLLTGNDVPSETEFNQLKEALSGWHAKVQDINKTAEMLRLTLTTLLKQREEIEQSIATFDPIFSPIRRVPDDVWGEIFYHCLPSHRNPIPITSEAPLVLTLVCQKWRRVALSSPWIWTKLHFSFQSSVTDEKYDPQGIFNRHWQLRLNGIRSWLSRSRNLPLSISLRCVVAGTNRKESDHVEREAMQIVIDHASRWQDLEISTAQNESFLTLYNMIDINPTTVPILRSLRLEQKRSGPCEFIDAPHYYQLPTKERYHFRKWLYLPTLRNVHADMSVRDVDVDGAPPIRCSNLTSMSLYHASPAIDIANVLLACPLLEECFLNLGHPYYSGQTSMILLPNLKRLWIEADLDKNYSLWEELDTPSLVELTLFQPIKLHGSYRTTSSLSAFLLRCKSLDKITFDPSILSRNVTEWIITSIPTVSHLQIDHPQCLTQRRYGQLQHSRAGQRTRLVELMARLEDVTDGPRITTLSAHVNLADSKDEAWSLMECLEKYIRPLSPVHSPQCYPSLDSVTLVLEGHPQQVEYNEAIDIAAETVKHAESVGRTVGKDLFLDITYPWKDSYEKDVKKSRKLPGPFVSAKEGLDIDTDRTWANVGV